MADLYDSHFETAGSVVGVVADEVRGWASIWVSAGDPKRIAGVKRAGAAAVNRYGNSLLASAIPTPVPEPADIAAILQALEAHADRKRPGRTPRVNEHAGETFSIFEAESQSLRFVSNDDGARHVAGSRGVPHESFVDIARRLSKCQQDVKPKQIVKELQRLVQNGVDTGDVVNSVLDLS